MKKAEIWVKTVYNKRYFDLPLNYDEFEKFLIASGNDNPYNRKHLIDRLKEHPNGFPHPTEYCGWFIGFEIKDL